MQLSPACRSVLALGSLTALGACSTPTARHPGAGGAPHGTPAAPPRATAPFTFESGPVRPLALSPDGAQVFVANTPNGSLDILRVTDAGLVPAGTVKVGIDPVAVAVKSRTEVWVVNHMSDSVSIVDVGQAPPRVVRTLLVGDEPRDIVFAKNGRAFITTAHRGAQRTSPELAGVPGAGDPQLTTPGVGRADVWVFDPAALSAPGAGAGGRPLAIIELFGDTPRGLAVSRDGATVYAAIYQSGNRTISMPSQLPCAGFDVLVPCIVAGNPVPASQPGPSTNHAGVPAPRVGLIVQADERNVWRDVRGIDWSSTTRFDLPDQDVFALDASTLAPTRSFRGVGTTLFNLAVNPRSGAVYVSNTHARNDQRFEGAGKFAGTTLQGHLAEARITILANGAVTPRHLNKHIPYTARPAPPGTAQHSLATPLDLTVSADGAQLYIAAYGSSKIGVLATAALEDGSFDPTRASADYLAVTGGGPSGLALDGRGRLFVATRFDNGVSMIDLARRAEISHLQLANPEAPAIIAGRRLLYDARATSSNGEASCAGCHPFGDTDHLVWDLGDPDGDVIRTPIEIRLQLATAHGVNGTGEMPALHPMKGPMATQTLRGTVHHGAMHWRGDRVDGQAGRDTASGPPFDSALSFRNFSVAFTGLLGRAAPIADADMRAFTHFALAIAMPPNPIRRLDNTLTPAQARGRAYFFGCDGLDSLTGEPVICQDERPAGAGHFADGLPMPGRGHTCEGCHVLRPDLGLFGTDGRMSFERLSQTFKIPQLRNLYTKVGMFGMPATIENYALDDHHKGAQVRGSGFIHDGSVDTLFRFFQHTVFSPLRNRRVGFAGGDAQRRDVEQYMFAFDSDLAPIVGQQVTLDSTNAASAGPRIDLLIERARTPFASKLLGPGATECALVVRGVIAGHSKTYAFTADGRFAPVGGGPTLDDTAVRSLATVGQPLTYTCLPPGWPR